MKREVASLLGSAVDSLVLSIDHFNRSDDRGRHNATLILMTHSLEMFLKAAILHRGGSIREKGEPHTIGFKACLGRGLSDARVQFLTDDQAVLLRATYGLRSAAQHHVIIVSEQQLYLHVQGGLTLFRDVYRSVFGKDLTRQLPARVLPVSTVPPLDIETLFTSQTSEVMKLLMPGRRSRGPALSRLAPLAVLSAASEGEGEPPSSIDLLRLAKRLRDGKSWEDVFPGAASLRLTTDGAGHQIQLRLVKKPQAGTPTVALQPVEAGTPGSAVVALKRVNELDFYNLGHPDLATHLGLTWPKLTAYIELLGLKADEACSKEFSIGKMRVRRYSQEAIARIKDAMDSIPPDEAWRRYRKARSNASLSVSPSSGLTA